MTYFKDPIISLFCSITACSLMLLAWPMLAYILLTMIVTYSIYKSAQNHPQIAKLVGQFLTEFLGFGLVLLVFVSMLVLMGAFFA